MNAKLDLEKLVWKLSISAQLPETFDLLCPKLLENLVFPISIPKGANPRFPKANDDSGDDRQTLKSRSRLLLTHPGMKYFCKGKPRC